MEALKTVTPNPGSEFVFPSLTSHIITGLPQSNVLFGLGLSRTELMPVSIEPRNKIHPVSKDLPVSDFAPITSSYVVERPQQNVLQDSSLSRLQPTDQELLALREETYNVESQLESSTIIDAPAWALEPDTPPTIPYVVDDDEKFLPM